MGCVGSSVSEAEIRAKLQKEFELTRALERRGDQDMIALLRAQLAAVEEQLKMVGLPPAAPARASIINRGSAARVGGALAHGIDGRASQGAWKMSPAEAAAAAAVRSRAEKAVRSVQAVQRGRSTRNVLKTATSLASLVEKNPESDQQRTSLTKLTSLGPEKLREMLAAEEAAAAAR